MPVKVCWVEEKSRANGAADAVEAVDAAGLAAGDGTAAAVIEVVEVEGVAGGAVEPEVLCAIADGSTSWAAITQTRILTTATDFLFR